MGKEANKKIYNTYLHDPSKKYAVFRSGAGGGNSMRFTTLHQHYEDAQNEAVRLLTDSVCNSEGGPCIYMVVEVLDKFIFDGETFTKK